MQHSVNFYFSLFNQGPNSPKFHGNPPHYMFTLHSMSFYSVLPCVTAHFIHQSYHQGSCKFNASALQSLIFVIYINHTFVPDFSFRTSKSESYVGSWTPLRRRWQPSRLSWLPMWVYLLQITASKQTATLHDNLMPLSVYSKGCLLKLWKEYKCSRHPLIPFVCVWRCCACL